MVPTQERKLSLGVRFKGIVSVLFPSPSLVLATLLCSGGASISHVQQ